MAVKFIGELKTYFFTYPSSNWEDWRTTDGLGWENLMGDSWETMYTVPKELQDYWDNEFKDKS
jgi:hypothetical protein